MRSLVVGASLALLLMPSLGHTQTPIDPLDARDARRVDKMEQVMRELRAIVFQGRDSGRPVVVQPAETDYQLQQLARRLSDLETTVTRLTGDLEEANHNLAQARQDLQTSRTANRDLTNRVLGLEKAKAEADATVQAAAQDAAAVAVMTPADVFSAAKLAFTGGDFRKAELGFQDYVDRFSDGPKAPEARYWLGKSLVSRAAHAEAATAFIGAIRGWPQTTWAADAVVELSKSLVQLHKATDACRTLDELDRRYPKATAAVQTRAKATRVLAKCAA
jgi:tol-pal system protein YbgF